jgi:D-alanyl-lipoteichoic acid acyltransferase DltB (MBOAT superfamily)
MAWEALSQRKNTQASMTQSWVSTLMITMLLGGLWHGAAWNYVAWGALHGVGLCANKLWREGPEDLG